MIRTAADYIQVGKLHPFDEQDKPKGATATDGRWTPISDEPRFDTLWNEWLADACAHDRKGIVRWVNGGNQTVYSWFCGHCGCKLSPNVKGHVAQDHGVFDVEMDALASRSRAYISQRAEHLDRLVAAAAERVQPGNREAYDDYLRSEVWRDLRSKILARARGVCEGCLDSPAHHVHHLTYRNIGNEFAYELAALCVQCHQRAHGRAT